MRKLLKFHSLKNLMRKLPRQNYCIYRRMQILNVCVSSGRFNSVYSLHNLNTLSSPDESVSSIADLQKEFPEPKKIIYLVLNEAFIRDQNLDLKPTVFTEQIVKDSNNEYLWKTRVQMKWPEAFEVEGVAKRKTDSLNISLLYACQKLKKLGVLDNTNKPSLQKCKIKDQDINKAKGQLMNIYHKIWHRFGKKNFMPKFNTVPCEGISGSFWQTELQITYPENKIFKSSSSRSGTAEGIASFEALLWLQDQRIISKNQRLLNYTKRDEEKLKELHQAPYPVCLPPAIQDKMQNVLSEIEKLKLPLLGKTATNFIDPIEEERRLSEEQNVRDIITDKLYYNPTNEELQNISEILYEKNKYVEKKLSTSLADIRNAKSLLPISLKRNDILKLINENQVVILSGDTGCGKSTQVPQFILDDYISKKRGAECNIVVTQPRRMSAVSLAERVAKERGEQVGDVVGYHIRLNRRFPAGKGAILYCTTGMLLRKWLSNPNLDGISHIIVDEIHERSIHIDFILILLKNLLETNKNIKLLLMSASFNTSIFAQYFKCSEVIHIPGKMYPVEEYFLEDLVGDIPNIKDVGLSEASLDVNLIVNTINHIDKKQPPGAILCFLPGWQEIRTVCNKLLESQENDTRLQIYPVHSRLPHEEQKKIFLKPPDNQRKVILATNIAETSLTIDDVVYVVDSGLHKGTYFDAESGIASLSTQWITKANVRQRKGRAGRVQSGKCYHLFSWKAFMRMEEYPVPEIVRMPLEHAILHSKVFCEVVKAEEFLSKGLQPPTVSAIQNGVNELQILGILDEMENLTDLGRVVATFSTHPRLSVALVYSAFLSCFDPVLTICAILTHEKEPFINTLDDKTEIRKIKAMHDNDLCSDHLALVKIYDTWNSLNQENVTQYLEANMLDFENLTYIKQLKELFAEDLYNSNLISFENLNFSQHNKCDSHVYILAALTAAFFPNVLKVIQGEISQGKLKSDSLVYSAIRGQKAYIQKESVASEKEDFPTPWLTYFSALKSEARRKAMLSSVTSIPGLCLLLLAGKNVHMSSIKGNKGQDTVLSIDDYQQLKFSCSAKEARLLLDWRECLQEMFKLFLQNLQQNSEEREYMILCTNKIIPILKEILELPQVPFTKGKVHKFVNNNLISKELEI